MPTPQSSLWKPKPLFGADWISAPASAAGLQPQPRADYLMPGFGNQTQAPIEAPITPFFAQQNQLLNQLNAPAAKITAPQSNLPTFAPASPSATADQLAAKAKRDAEQLQSYLREQDIQAGQAGPSWREASPAEMDARFKAQHGTDPGRPPIEITDQAAWDKESENYAHYVPANMPQFPSQAEYNRWLWDHPDEARKIALAETWQRNHVQYSALPDWRDYVAENPWRYIGDFEANQNPVIYGR